LDHGIESRFASFAHAPEETFLRIPPPGVSRRKVLRYLAALVRSAYVRRCYPDLQDFVLGGRSPFSQPVRPLPTPLPAEWFAGSVPTVVNLHWLGAAFDYPSLLSSIPDDTPIVWTLRDMHALSGGCHCAWDCEGFGSDCANCPLLKPPRQRFPQRNLVLKRALYRTRRISFVGISQWMTAQARKASVVASGSRVDCIANAVDYDVFRPLDREAARSVLDLDPSSFVVCFGCTDVRTLWKGGQFLPEAIRLLKPRVKNLSLLVFGDGGLPDLGVPTRHLGRISSSDFLRIAYAAADVFAMPSLQEAFGNTCAESMACGTPVVAFRVGGIVDMIEDGRTGLLAEPGSAEGLAAGIERLSADPALALAIARDGRLKIEREFGYDRLAREYAALYESLLGEASCGAVTTVTGA
jgi:glycosyltransferase involved in cell wall biosynthesis